MSKIKHIKIENKIATYDKADGVIVCDNDSYEIEFAFDSEWDAYHDKKARFIVYVNGRYEGITVPFSGNICPVPPVYNVRQLKVGVFVDKTICTTTEAVIDCFFSILSGKVKNLTGFGGAASVDDGAPYYVLKKELTDYKEAHKDDYTNEQIDKMLEGVGGGGGGDCSDVYILGDDETLDDVPESADIVIDPNGDPSGGGGGGDIDLTGVLKYTPQALTEEEKTQARANIGAVSQTEFNEDTLNLSTSIVNYTAASLKWDGNIGTRDKVLLLRNEFMEIYVVHISDEVPPLEVFEANSATATIDVESVSFSSNFETIGEGVIGALGSDIPIIVVDRDNTTIVDGGVSITFPKRGIYFGLYVFVGEVDGALMEVPFAFVTSLYLMGYPFNNAPSYNDLKDKPFYTEEKNYYFGSVRRATETDFEENPNEISLMPHALFWNGDTSGMTRVFLGNGTVFNFYYASSCIISQAELNYVAVNLADVEQTKEGVEHINDSVSFASGVVFVRHNNAIIEGLTFPKAGIYFADNIRSLMVAGYTFPAEANEEIVHTLDPKYLPEALHFGENGGYTFTYNGALAEPNVNIDHEDIDDVRLVKVSSLVPTIADMEGRDLQYTFYDSEGKNEDTLRISDAQIVKDDGFIVLKDFLGAIVPTNNYVHTENGHSILFPEAGVYFLRVDTGSLVGYVSSLVIPEGIKKIDEKYLPSATIVYADYDNYLYATSDTSDTSKRMTASELKEIALGGNKVLVCTGIEINGSSVEIYLVPTSFTFGAFGSEHIGTVIVGYGEDINQYTTAEYDPTATTQEGVT